MDVTKITQDGRTWLKRLAKGHEFDKEGTSQHHNPNCVVPVNKPVKLIFQCYHYERQATEVTYDAKGKKKAVSRSIPRVKVEDAPKQLDIPAGSHVVIYRSYEAATSDEAVAAIFVPAVSPEVIYTIYLGHVRTRKIG